MRNRCVILDNEVVTIRDSIVTIVFLHHIFRDLARYPLLTFDQLCLPITARLSKVRNTGTGNQFRVVSVTIGRRIGLELRVFVASLLRMSVNE